MEWNSRFLIFAIYGNAKDEWNSAESKRSMAEDARENKKNDRSHCSGDDYHDKRMNDCLPPILFSAIFKLLKVLPDTELDAC